MRYWYQVEPECRSQWQSNALLGGYSHASFIPDNCLIYCGFVPVGGFDVGTISSAATPFLHGCVLLYNIRSLLVPARKSSSHPPLHSIQFNSEKTISKQTCLFTCLRSICLTQHTGDVATVRMSLLSIFTVDASYASTRSADTADFWRGRDMATIDLALPCWSSATAFHKKWPSNLIQHP